MTESDDEQRVARWVHHDPWVIVGGALVFLLVLGWVVDPPGSGGPGVLKQLGLLATFLGPVILGAGVLAGFAGRGLLADLARWFVVVTMAFWVLGIGAALTFATGKTDCIEQACTTSSVARLTGAVPIAGTWLAARELAHRIASRRNRGH